ncbi:MAG: DUF4870 family protein [Methylococcaceae bacterium]
MNDVTNNQKNAEHLQSLKKLTAIVYICQVLAFAFAGLPLLVGAAINFIKKNEVKGTWLESHFDWQIKTAWMTLAGLAMAGLTFETGIGLFILIPTMVLLVYRIVVGWNTLNADQPIKDNKN